MIDDGDPPPRVIDLARAVPPAIPGVAAAAEAALPRLARRADRARLPRAGPARAAGAHRGAVHRARPADHARTRSWSPTARTTAFALALRLLTGPGDRVLVEQPTYPNAIEAIRAAHAIPVPGRDDRGRLGPRRHGGDPAPGRAAARVPDRRLPEPDRLPARRGRPGAARRRAAPGPDPGRRRRDAGRAGLHATVRRRPARRVRAATSCWPPARRASRTGAACGSAGCGRPRRWSTGSLAARRGLDLGSPVFEQLVLAELLAAPRDALAERRRAARRAAGRARGRRARAVPGLVVPAAAPAGSSLWCRLPAPVSTRIAAVAQNFGVRVVPGSFFAPARWTGAVAAAAVRRTGGHAARGGPAAVARGGLGGGEPAPRSRKTGLFRSHD